LALELVRDGRERDDGFVVDVQNDFHGFGVHEDDGFDVHDVHEKDGLVGLKH